MNSILHIEQTKKERSNNLGLLKEGMVVAGVQTHIPKVYTLSCGVLEQLHAQ